EHIFGRRKTSREEVGPAHCLPRMPHVRQVTQGLELGAALFEQSTRQIEIAQPHVDVTETEQRASLESGILAAAALFQHTVERIERGRQVALSRERSPKPVEGA